MKLSEKVKEKKDKHPVIKPMELTTADLIRADQIKRDISSKLNGEITK